MKSLISDFTKTSITPKLYVKLACLIFIYISSNQILDQKELLINLKLSKPIIEAGVLVIGILTFLIGTTVLEIVVRLIISALWLISDKVTVLENALNLYDTEEREDEYNQDDVLRTSILKNSSVLYNLHQEGMKKNETRLETLKLYYLFFTSLSIDIFFWNKRYIN